MGYQSVSEFWALKIIFPVYPSNFLLNLVCLFCVGFVHVVALSVPFLSKTQIGLTVQYLFLSINRLGKSWTSYRLAFLACSGTKLILLHFFFHVSLVMLK